MFKAKAAALLLAGLAVTALSEPAAANVVYDLSFGGGVTGVLTLDFSSVAQTENISFESPLTQFVSLTVDGLDSQNFTITSSNLASGSYIGTGAEGQIYSLQIQEDAPGSGNYLWVYNSSWQIHQAPNGNNVGNGNLSISGPSLAATPLSPSWTMMLLGLAGLGFVTIASRRRGSQSNQRRVWAASKLA